MFMDEWGGGRVSRFAIENFLSHSIQKNLLGESFGVSLKSGIEKC